MTHFFKTLLLMASAGLVLTARAQTMQAPDITKQPTLYVVPYAHLDTQWRWDFPQSISEYLLKTLSLDERRLWVTIFREDDDAEELWKAVGVSPSRIVRLGEKDNFWSMGDEGPCGPCSEIHYDMGPAASEAGHQHEAFPSDAGGRFVEIWNLVFMQFNRDSNGVLTPLPRPSIDTGMGLERVAAVLQGKLSNYDTDLILPIIARAADMFGVSYGADARVDTALRIAADHCRATTFLIHDGVLPANDGRGYVLRKIMRRAMRHVRLIGVEDPFLQTPEAPNYFAEGWAARGMIATICPSCAACITASATNAE